MPYWDWSSDSQAPELSEIWNVDYFGEFIISDFGDSLKYRSEQLTAECRWQRRWSQQLYRHGKLQQPPGVVSGTALCLAALANRAKFGRCAIWRYVSYFDWISCAS